MRRFSNGAAYVFGVEEKVGGKQGMVSLVLRTSGVFFFLNMLGLTEIKGL